VYLPDPRDWGQVKHELRTLMPYGLFTIALGPRTTISSDNMVILTCSCHDFVFQGKEILLFAEVADRQAQPLGEERLL
jgi:hypothetical protein